VAPQAGRPGERGSGMTVTDQAADPYAGETGTVAVFTVTEPAVSRRRLGPVLTLNPARETRPMAAVPGAVRAVAVDMPEQALVPVRACRTDRAALQRVLDALRRDTDWGALDAARAREGLTYAEAAGPLTAPEWPADGPARIYDAVLLAAGRTPQVRPPLAEAARRRIRGLKYQAVDGCAPEAAYDELLVRVAVITGTQGIKPNCRAIGDAR
jgi:hypothetical protein